MRGCIALLMLTVAAGAARSEGCDDYLTPAFFRKADAGTILTCAEARGLDARGEDGSTALHLAASEGNATLVRDLLVRGADLALRDRNGLTPLDAAAARSTDAAAAAWLIAWGAPVDPPDGWLPRDRGVTPLMRAASRPEAADLVAAFLAAGADPNWRNPEGDTALHLAMRNPDGDAIGVLLLHRGAEANVGNNEGETPLHMAASYVSTPAMLRLLVGAGASADAAGPDGVTPLMLAASYATNADVFAAVLDAAEDPCRADENTRTARLLAEANPVLRDSEPYWRLNQLCPAPP